MKSFKLKNFLKFNKRIFTNTNINTNKNNTNKIIENDFDFFSHKFTTEMQFRKHAEKFQCFRVMDLEGNIISKNYENIPKEKALRIFNTMVKIHESDIRLNMAQREGKISFYMTCIGEEASVTASCAALDDSDMIFPQYREAACILYRGIPLQLMIHQLAGNSLDTNKGRQMPVHYGYKSINFQSVSSPLCTQVPQASGAGYHYRVQNLDRIAVTYFGEGAASEGDFHPALNFAATLKSQTLFICRNNMYAISTPIDDQYGGDGIAARGLAYGINTIRCDGNDVFAVYNAVKAAREYIVKNKAPALVEIMSYRGGDHSTSDFSKMYRTEEEMKKWNEFIANIGNPINRFYSYLEKKKWINEKEYKQMIDSSKEEVRECLKNSMKVKLPSIESLFDDVYENLPVHLVEQRDHLKKHIEKYAEQYEIDKYAK